MMKNLRNLRNVLGMLVLAIFIIAAGCAEQSTVKSGSDSEQQQAVADQKSKAANNQDAATQSGKTTVKVYFPNEDGTKLIAKSRAAQVAPDPYTAAMQALLKGTKDQGTIAVIPEKVKLQSIKVEKQIAYVSFSQEMVKNFNGGSTGEIMLVGSIVNTLTEFPEIKAVQILIEGRKVETIAGHMDLSEPLKRFDDILKN